MPNIKNLQIKTLVVSPFEQNCRLIFDPATCKVCIIDPGDDCDRILSEIDLSIYSIESIFLTHSHIDHAGGVETLIKLLSEKKVPKPKLYAHEAEKSMRQNLARQAAMFGLGPQFQSVREPDHYLNHNDKFKIGNSEFTVLFTPGHSPGHLALYSDKILIAGDALFKGSIGRTDLPGGNHAQLINSIKTHFFSLPDDTVVLSGHGLETSIGTEKNSKPFLI